MNMIQAIEIFAFVTGLVYLVLEIAQKNLMWVLGILTGAACAWSFGVQHLWASMGLNVYYVFVSVWGLYQWRKAAGKLGDEGGIHLARPSRKVLWISLFVFLAGSALLIFLLRYLGDSESSLDAVVAVASAIGTWWLARSYPQQWLVWIAADLLSTLLCLVSGMYWMSALYLAYSASAVLGWYHWTKNGKYI